MTLIRLRRFPDQECHPAQPYSSLNDGPLECGQFLRQQDCNETRGMSIDRAYLGATARMWLKVTGTIFALVLPVPWILGNFMILAAGSGESVSVRNTGMVTTPDVLKWTEWLPGKGPLVRMDDLYPNITIDDKAEIVEYRIGIDRKLFAQLTFYQAKYRLPDGTIQVGPANGPKSLISVDTPLAIGFSLIAGAISILCFWLASKEPEPLRD